MEGEWKKKEFHSFSLFLFLFYKKDIVIIFMQSYTDRTKLLSSYKKADECKLSELVQYQCEVGSTHIECNPFVRLFLK